MKLTNEQITALEEKVNAYLEWEALTKAAKEEMTKIENEIKEVMTEQNTETLETPSFIIRWTSILSNRFDSTNFKKAMPEVYKAYVKQIASRRFTISK